MSESRRISQTLFVAAVVAELQGLLREPHLALDGPFPLYRLSNGALAAVSGIGRANAAAATAHVLALHGPAEVVNVGIAGALPGSGLAAGDVVCATASVFVEEGIELPGGATDMNGLGFALVEAEWAKGNVMEPEAALRSRVLSALQESGLEVSEGVIATVARCSGSDGAAARVVEETARYCGQAASAEAMEGAATVLAARRLGMAAAEVRVISNTCGDRDRQEWDLKQAMEMLATVTERLHQRLPFVEAE